MTPTVSFDDLRYGKAAIYCPDNAAKMALKTIWESQGLTTFPTSLFSQATYMFSVNDGYLMESIHPFAPGRHTLPNFLVDQIDVDYMASFLAGKHGVVCADVREYKYVLEDMEKRGKVWASGSKPTTPMFSGVQEFPVSLTFGDKQGIRLGLKRCTGWAPNKAGCRNCHPNDCGHTNSVPFAKLYPNAHSTFAIDTKIAEFLAGKAFINVKMSEYPAFQVWADTKRLLWYMGDKASDYIPCDFRLGDLTSGKGENIYLETTSRYEGLRLNAYNGLGNNGGMKMPIYLFSDLMPIPPVVTIATPGVLSFDRAAAMEAAQVKPATTKTGLSPMPENPKPRPKVGDRFIMLEDTSLFSKDEEIFLSHDDGTRCPMFKSAKTGREGYVFFPRMAKKPVFTVYPATPLKKEQHSYRLDIQCKDGKTTTAVMYVDGVRTKTGRATCSPEDDFDFNTGAAIAFNRMRFGADFNSPDFGEFEKMLKDIKGLGDKATGILGNPK